MNTNIESATTNDTDLTPAQVSEFFNALDKAVRSRRLYAENNPTYLAFLASLKSTCAALWETGHALVCTVEESAFRWEDQTFSPGEGRDNLAFQFYKDGIRALKFLPGFEEEVDAFLNVLSRVRQAEQTSTDDLVTLLWEQEFISLQYSYVDALAEGIEIPEAGPITFDKIELTLIAEDAASTMDGTDPETAPEAVQQGQPPVPQTISREDFSETMYFMEPNELDNLRIELDREWQRDVKRDVLYALFDRLEDPSATRQTEILRILRQLLPAYLGGGDLLSASIILIELNKVMSAADTLGEAQKREAQDIFAELNEPGVLDQLLKSLEEGAIDPSGEELAIFLRYMRADALAPLIRATETTRLPELQKRLRSSVEGLARQHPEIVNELLKNKDEFVVVGSARLAGRIAQSTTVPALASLLKDPLPSIRRAATEALVMIKSGAALDALQNAFEDSDRDVRITAARGIGGLRYQPARVRLEAVLQGRIVRDADLTEKMAFFEAFGSVATPDSVAMLDRMLNGKKLFSKESTELRACAAMALGKVGTPASRAALQRAADDKEPMVRNAVTKALREESASP